MTASSSRRSRRSRPARPHDPRPPLKKLGYKGVESTELVFEASACRRRASSAARRASAQGFKHFMAGIEVGRVNVAARGAGIAQAALDDAIRYAQEREAFGKPIAQHQAIQLKLAKMATKLAAARLLDAPGGAGEGTPASAPTSRRGWRSCSRRRPPQEGALDAMRIHGGYGYSQEYPLERYYRDAPLLLIGEGSNEIQQLIIARRLLERDAG